MCPQSLVSLILKLFQLTCVKRCNNCIHRWGAQATQASKRESCLPGGENAVILEASSVVSGAGSRTSFSTWLKAGEGLAVVILHVVRWVGKGNMHSCTLKFLTKVVYRTASMIEEK